MTRHLRIFYLFSRPVYSNFVYRKSVDIFVTDFNEIYVLPRSQFYVRLYTGVELNQFCVCVPPLKFKFGTNGKQPLIRHTIFLCTRDTKYNENVFGGFEE